MEAFSTPLTFKSGSFASTTNYDVIVRQQLIDALVTNQGERVMRPDWGCDIQAVLFDPSDSLERSDAASYIRDRLTHLVPRALVMSVEVKVANNQPNLVYIDVHYKTSNYSPASTLSVEMNTTSTATAGGNQ